MEPFSIIKDADIFDNPVPEPKTYETRDTVKGIILDNEGKIATYFIHGRNLFPGGGVEIGETREQAFLRECKEEIGCDVEIIFSLGDAIEYRAKVGKKYEIHFFIAKVIGKKGLPTTTQADEQHIRIDWLSKKETLDLLQTQISSLSSEVYMPHFSCRTHLAAFKKYLE